MDDLMFDELLVSVRQGGAMLRGEIPPSRTFQVTPLDVSAIRRQFALPPAQFAQLLRISPETLQGWEQGHTQPDGPAYLLLRIAAKYPETVLEMAQAG